jgi:hypothetical protein
MRAIQPVDVVGGFSIGHGQTEYFELIVTEHFSEFNLLLKYS